MNKILVIYLAAALFAFSGWCINIYKFLSADFESPYKAEIIRGIGIPVPPVGVISGWFVEFEEEKE